jgi:hypothetical protein
LEYDLDNTERLVRVLPELKKPSRKSGQREGYPDYIHQKSWKRIELKCLFVDNPNLALKRPPSKREPSARLREKMKDIEPSRDVLLVAAIRLERIEDQCLPVITDIEPFSMFECIKARDERLEESGKWINNKPYVMGKKGDYEPDTNFGKLKRIP